jgi:hypothetical protein
MWLKKWKKKVRMFWRWVLLKNVKKKMKKIMKIVLCTTVFHSYPCQTRSIASACLSSRAFKGHSNKIKN